MSYQDSDNTQKEDATFKTLLGWLAAAAAIIASIANAIVNHYV